MPTTRDQALSAAWVACGKVISEADWLAAFSGWDVEPVVNDGHVIGAVMARGTEVHVAVLPGHSGRWCTPRLWRWAISDRLRKHGHVVTTGRHDNEFIRRAGFQPLRQREDGAMVFVRYA